MQIRSRDLERAFCAKKLTSEIAPVYISSQSKKLIPKTSLDERLNRSVLGLC